MLYPLMGFASTLADEECAAVRLVNTEDGAEVVFSREGEDGWAPEDAGFEPIHTPELMASIQGGFGTEWDRVECVLAAEAVVYAIERGAVRVMREALEPERPEDGLQALAEALGIPKSRRRPKLKQAVQFAGIVQKALAGAPPGPVRILDLACGRSYLGFVLAHQLAAGGREVELHGVDSQPALVEKCREIAGALGWSNATFAVEDLNAYSVAPGAYDLAVSLHACDTLTDEAIRIACTARVPRFFAAPCCQHELRHRWQDHPLKWIARYGLLEQHVADTLTDGFRCMVLEAMGYRVKVLRFAAPDVTPKNLLIQAELTGGPRPERAEAARDFLRRFGVRLRLAALLEAPR
jgi:SAM-dependent methyltransferase